MASERWSRRFRSCGLPLEVLQGRSASAAKAGARWRTFELDGSVRPSRWPRLNCACLDDEVGLECGPDLRCRRKSAWKATAKDTDDVNSAGGA